MNTRSCNKCKEVKVLDEFTKMSSNKNGRGAICKVCKRTNDKEYSSKNREKIRATNKKRYDADRPKAISRIIELRVKRKDKVNAYKREYDKRKPEIKNKNEAKRRATKLKAMPKWLTKEQIQRIADMYKQAAELTRTTGIKYVVDHIIPLQGKTVCGFHHPDNLRVITESENMSKSNKLLEELLN